jgi:Na+/proline symporter
MASPDPFENEEVKHLRFYLYLIPVIGFLPAFWTLYSRQGTRQERNVSRLAITLALGWLAGYCLLAAGASTAETLSTPLLITSSVLTSSYFLVNLWLMVCLWQRKPLRLPGISQLSDRLP